MRLTWTGAPATAAVVDVLAYRTDAYGARYAVCIEDTPTPGGRAQVLAVVPADTLVVNP